MNSWSKNILHFELHLNLVGKVFKVVCSYSFSSPRAQMKVYNFLISPKFQIQIHYYLGSWSRKFTYFWYTNFELIYFHISLIPSVTYLILPGEQIRRQNMAKCVFGVNPFGVENTHVKISIAHLRLYVTITNLKS